MSISSRICAALLTGLALTLTAPVAAQDFAITGATLAIGDGSEPIQNGTVIVRNGRVTAAGTGLAIPDGITAIDGTGTWVTPGLFATLTDLGIYDVDAVGESSDIGSSGADFHAALDIAPVINPAAQQIAISRAGGVTRASVAPRASGSIFAGQGAIIDLGDDRQAVRHAKAFQYVELGEDGGRFAGGTRMAAYADLRNALTEARAFADGSWSGEDSMLTRADAEALVPVITGQQPLYVEVERAADILSALALKDSYPALDMVLVGASEGWLVAKEIAASGIPVIAVALNDLPDRFERLAATQSNIGRMVDAGVVVAIGRFYDMNHPRYAPQQAGNLVALNAIPGATGLSWGEAFAAISSIPATISGAGGHAGVLIAGAHGDVVIWDGDPLEVSSAPVRVFIDGVEQTLDNHQTRLRDRYRDLDESDLPKAYDW